MKNKLKFSIVIPVCNDLNYLKALLDSISKQSIEPNEIIIIDSSTNLEIQNFFDNNYLNLNIIYKSYYNTENFKYGFPGLSRNIGSKLSENDDILFLDTKTILPKNNFNWLNDFYKIFLNSGKDYLIGKTLFIPNNYLQEIHYSSSYGNKIYNTVPGSFVKKGFIRNNQFLPNLRAGEDMEWKIRVNNKIPFQHYDSNGPLIYNDKNNSLLNLIFKYILYSFHSAKTEIQINTKHLYLSLLLILSLLIVPRWNFIIGGWTSNPLYIPNVTKIYFISIILLLLINIFINYFFFRKIYESILTKTLKIITLIIITYSIINWNIFIANFVEYSVFVIPHITKIYILSLLGALILFRGIYKPIKNSIKLRKIFPFKFLLIGSLGLLLDLVKMPGYIFGSLISLFNFSNKN